jgi:hypothetical protein
MTAQPSMLLPRVRHSFTLGCEQQRSLQPSA